MTDTQNSGPNIILSNKQDQQPTTEKNGVIVLRTRNGTDKQLFIKLLQKAARDVAAEQNRLGADQDALDRLNDQIDRNKDKENKPYK